MSLRNMTLYSIFIRNFGGTFAGVEKELPGLKALGVDAIWLMPIHPIGKVKRKGSLGSPYAIADYRAVNPEFGTMEDFTHLCDTVHAQGLKVLIDVVYNHTSPDSVLAATHPEWFYHKPDGSFGNRIGDWTDIIDLDYGNRDLWDYQIETLCFWAKYVDGFRCDVAPLVPLDFWLAAREAVEKVRPGCIWLAESVEGGFVRYNREHGIPSLSDGELYRAFDICYDYDVYDTYIAYVRGEVSLETYIAALEKQECIYPENYVKLRFTENHDRVRTAFLLPDRTMRENHLAWCFFQKGMPMLYSGTEWGVTHRPTLFDADPVIRYGAPIHGELLRRLIAMKKDPLFDTGRYAIKACPRDTVVAAWTSGSKQAVGVFSLRGQKTVVETPLTDGTYKNLLDDTPVTVEYGMVSTDGRPIIVTINA